MFDTWRERIAFFRFHFLHRRSRAAIQRWQQRRLQRMVLHAYKNVPLYHDLYSSVDPSVRESVTLETLRLLPVVLKSQYMGRPVEEYTDNSERADGSWIKTSGTSGAPFNVLERKDLVKPYYAESLIYRAFTSGHPWRFVQKMRIARIMTKSPPLNNRLFITITEHREHMREVVQRIIDFKPEILESFASILYDTARIVERENLPLRVPYVISGGERMTPGLRAYLERVLGCEVYNRFGMEEFSLVAMECAEHNGLHTNCESLIVEVVDDAGNPVPDGEDGRILVTDLYNTTMPYIRYDTGDHGMITWEKCACGLESPRVWLEGRYSAWLSFGGRRINHLEYDLALDSYMNVILQYQVVKKSETEAVIVVVPGIGFNDQAAADIIASVSELLGESVRVRIECVQEIPRVGRGKSQIVADHSAGNTS